MLVCFIKCLMKIIQVFSNKINMIRIRVEKKLLRKNYLNVVIVYIIRISEI